MTKQKAASAVKRGRPSNKSKAAMAKQADALARPCIVPDRHVHVCDCYGVNINRHTGKVV